MEALVINKETKEIKDVNEIVLILPDETVNDYFGCCIFGGGVIET